MSATRPNTGWRTGRRKRKDPETLQAQRFAVALRRRLTEACEALLRAVFSPAHALARDLIGTPSRDAADALRVGVVGLIAEHAARLGVPGDCLMAEVDVAGGRIGLRFLMPTDSDQQHLQAVVRELAARERGA